MASALEIFTGESVDVEISLAAERAFDLFIPVDDQRGHFNALDGQRIVHQPFRVAGPDLIRTRSFQGMGDRAQLCLLEVIILFSSTYPVNRRRFSRKLSNRFSWILVWFSPVSFSTATILCTSADAPGNRNEPVSVMTPAYRQAAISLLIIALCPQPTIRS